MKCSQVATVVTLLVLASYASAKPLTTCGLWSQCMTWTAKAEYCTECGSNCAITVCVDMDTSKSGCQKDGGAISHYCERDSSYCYPPAGISTLYPASTYGFKDKNGTAKVSVCQTGQPGSYLHWVFKDGSSCSGTACTSVALKDANGVQSGHSLMAKCAPSNATLGTWSGSSTYQCTGNSQGKECGFTVQIDQTILTAAGVCGCENENHQPDITCPADMSVSTLPFTSGTETISWSVTGIDANPSHTLSYSCKIDPSMATATCNSAGLCSHDFMPGMVHTVMCKSYDGIAYSEECSFTVSVPMDECGPDACNNTETCEDVNPLAPESATCTDTLAPNMTCPSGNLCHMLMAATDVLPVTIPLSPDIVHASDLSDPSVQIVCTDSNNNPVSLTTHAFPLGLTTVTCTATDDNNNSAHCTFNVNVVDMVSPAFGTCPNETSSGPGYIGNAIVHTSAPATLTDLMTTIANSMSLDASDNVEVASVECVPAEGKDYSCYPLCDEPIQADCTVTDTSNNKNICALSQSVCGDNTKSGEEDCPCEDSCTGNGHLGCVCNDKPSLDCADVVAVTVTPTSTGATVSFSLSNFADDHTNTTDLVASIECRRANGVDASNFTIFVPVDETYEFPVGTTDVDCWVVDTGYTETGYSPLGGRMSDTCPFTVTVSALPPSNDPPDIACNDITGDGAIGGVAVDFALTLTDDHDDAASMTLSCTVTTKNSTLHEIIIPVESGVTKFPNGTFEVTCTVTDNGYGTLPAESSSCSFNVTHIGEIVDILDDGQPPPLNCSAPFTPDAIDPLEAVLGVLAFQPVLDSAYHAYSGSNTAPALGSGCFLDNAPANQGDGFIGTGLIPGATIAGPLADFAKAAGIYPYTCVIRNAGGDILQTCNGSIKSCEHEADGANCKCRQDCQLKANGWECECLKLERR